LANHWLQLVGVAAIIVVIRTLLSMNEKLGQVISYTGLNDWRLRNEVDAIKRSISHVCTTSNNAGENLSSLIWAVKTEIAELKKLLEDGLFVYGVDEHERRRQARSDHHVQNSHQKAEAGDLSAQAHYAELLAIEGDYVQAYMWLHIAVTRADKDPARFFRASAIGFAGYGCVSTINKSLILESRQPAAAEPAIIGCLLIARSPGDGDRRLPPI
jgi:hypothetical protein